MVEDSVDDMYFGCNEAMMEIIKDKYFEREKTVFADDWNNNNVLNCADEKFKQREDQALTREHMHAICVYTYELYKDFNVAGRTKRSDYGSSFQFHSLHYLLTSAVQILNNNHICHTTFRRTNVKFTGKVNQIIRFGSFTSSSYCNGLKEFGDETCFEITTCSGAFLKSYSFYSYEAEVLIPPYEMFKITHIINGPGKPKGLEDCKVVFVMESAGINSNLNCKVHA